MAAVASPSRYLTVSEAAQRLGVHPKTIRAYADMGMLPFMRLPGGHRRFQDEDIEEFRRQHTVEAREPTEEELAKNARAGGF
jgi:excisionase family DNA binding protein